MNRTIKIAGSFCLGLLLFPVAGIAGDGGVLSESNPEKYAEILPSGLQSIVLDKQGIVKSTVDNKNKRWLFKQAKKSCLRDVSSCILLEGQSIEEEKDAEQIKLFWEVFPTGMLAFVALDGNDKAVASWVGQEEKVQKDQFSQDYLSGKGIMPKKLFKLWKRNAQNFKKMGKQSDAAEYRYKACLLKHGTAQKCDKMFASFMNKYKTALLDANFYEAEYCLMSKIAGSKRACDKELAAVTSHQKYFDCLKKSKELAKVTGTIGAVDISTGSVGENSKKTSFLCVNTDY